MTAPFSIRFHGVRGSIPSPGAHSVRYGGETTCLEIRVGERMILIDCGSGIRRVGPIMRRDGFAEADLLLTHTHLDHICGLPFFCAAYDPSIEIRFWSGHLAEEEGSLDAVIRRVMSPPIFPVSVGILKKCSFHSFSPPEQPAIGGDITVETMMLNHPGGAVAYRISSEGRSFCTVTDHEHGDKEIDAALADFVRNADAIVYDSMFTDDEYGNYLGWGHSTWQKGIELAVANGIKTPVLFHHDPDRSDDELDRIAVTAKERHPGALVAKEGMVIEL